MKMISEIWNLVKKKAEAGSVFNLKRKTSCCHTTSQVFVLRSWDYGNYSDHAMSNYYSVYYQSLHLCVIKWKLSSLRKFCMLLSCTFRHLYREHTLKHILQTDVVCHLQKKNKLRSQDFHYTSYFHCQFESWVQDSCTFSRVHFLYFWCSKITLVSWWVLQVCIFFDTTKYYWQFGDFFFLVRDTTLQIFTIWHCYY